MGLLFTAATWGSLAQGSRVRAGRPRWWHIRVLVRKEASLLEDRARVLGSSATGEAVVAVAVSVRAEEKSRRPRVAARPTSGAPVFPGNLSLGPSAMSFRVAAGLIG
jgi:hypothetical protein